MTRGKLVGRYASLAELFDALDRGTVRVPKGGIVRAHAVHFPPAYVSESWVDGYQERYRLSFEDSADTEVIELFAL